MDACATLLRYDVNLIPAVRNGDNQTIQREKCCRRSDMYPQYWTPSIGGIFMKYSYEYKLMYRPIPTWKMAGYTVERIKRKAAFYHTPGIGHGLRKPVEPGIETQTAEGGLGRKV